MDYEKKYNEAIKRAKQHCADYVVETIFPELKESDGEKMRRQTLKVLNYYKDEEKSEGRIPTEIDECISWYPNHGKHYDMIIQYRINFYQKIKSFINYIKKSKLKIRKSVIDNKNESIFTNISKFNINSLKY